MQYKKFVENFLLEKKLPNQKWNLGKTLYFEKNYYSSQKWKQSTLLGNRLRKKLWSKKKPGPFRKTSGNPNSNLHFHYFYKVRYR